MSTTRRSFRRINGPRRSSKERSRSHLHEAGPRVGLHGAEAPTQKGRGGQSPRGRCSRSSGACLVRLDLHISPILIIFFGAKIGEVGGLASYRVRSSKSTYEFHGRIILYTATMAGSVRVPSRYEDNTAHR